MATDFWLIALRASTLHKRNPIPVMVDGVPVVLFRDSHGRPKALLDRCPHRAVPLSLGWVRGDRIICAYHGWEFDGEGVLHRIPSDVEPTLPKPCAQAFPVKDAGPYLWVAVGRVPAEPPSLGYAIETVRNVQTFQVSRARDVVRRDVLARLMGQAPWDDATALDPCDVVLRQGNQTLIVRSPGRIVHLLVREGNSEWATVIHVIAASAEATRVEVTQGWAGRSPKWLRRSGPQFDPLSLDSWAGESPAADIWQRLEARTVD